MNTLYTNTPRLVLGFHGCEKEVARNVLLLNKHLKQSKNDYDWLGHGTYFWENDPIRAYEFALKSKKKDPAVIGAVIDLGNCLSLMERNAIELIKFAHESLLNETKHTGLKLPNNIIDVHGHKMKRKLDCAVFEKLHEIIETVKEPKYDTVIGTFMEGAAAYSGTEIYEQTHIQVCVRNLECIKGYFLPLGDFESDKKTFLKAFIDKTATPQET